MKVEIESDNDLLWPEAKDGCKGYFSNIIWPLLESGEEIDLYNWLKDNCLLQSSGRCPAKFCGMEMTWMKARVRDKYNWQCNMKGCVGRLPIRHGSFFSNIHCEIKKALEVILGWCGRQSIEECCERLDLLPRVVSRVYSKCIEVASEHVSSHPEEWLLGGSGSIVLVDVFPSVYMGPNYLAKTSSTEPRPKRILCIADLKFMPPRVWMSLLDDKPEDIKKNKEKVEETGFPPTKKKRSGCKNQAEREEKGVGAVLAHLAQVVIPGTKVIGTSRWAPVQPLLRLTGLSGLSVESLTALDPPDTKRMTYNLRNIWQTTSEICEEAQSLPRKEARNYILEFMWRQIHGTSTSIALERILQHIAIHYAVEKKEENDLFYNE